MFFADIHTRNQQVLLPTLREKNIEVFMKREDEIHTFVSGNKFRKLKYNILEAKNRGVKTILTFGGAYSNHIAATAVAGKLYGLKTIGIIRGEELGRDVKETMRSNATLREACENGMHFDFISREAYRNKEESAFIKSMKEKHGDFYLIPEGGTNDLAIKGCEEILTNEDASFDYICCCVGTAGTISGVIRSTNEDQKVIGFPALKGDFLTKEIQQYVGDNNTWELQTDYHFGGYAKYEPSLIHFMNQFKDATGIPLDPIYTGKMVFGVVDMIKKGQFSEGSSILMIHTGGLQGIEGFNTMLAKKNKELQINS
ncbi:pyridoxal-phosphate dependent enzyme [Flavobacteriaceae bacterium S356]|uniref:Pyridoxal-phosphate dependent enzyme n=1 Tax=Asprobacillus argus TaxID=3076534 RepID=A0ABU3LFG4_9FLAO|nr:pyridoxal-phosphate dependent enzyme [Flavobacteriaceae bacterium S356]